MTSAVPTPLTKKAAAELHLDDGQDQNTFQGDRSMKNATESVAQTTDTPLATGELWTRIICAQIDEARRRLGMSLREFSRRTEIPASTAQRLLAGRGRCTIDRMSAGARVVGVSLAELMRGASAEVNR